MTLSHRINGSQQQNADGSTGRLLNPDYTLPASTDGDSEIQWNAAPYFDRGRLMYGVKILALIVQDVIVTARQLDAEAIADFTENITALIDGDADWQQRLRDIACESHLEATL